MRMAKKVAPYGDTVSMILTLSFLGRRPVTGLLKCVEMNRVC